MTLPEKLRLLMRRHGLTQASLGAVVGLSHRAVGKWLAGDSSPGADVAMRLANFFEISVDSLLDDTRELPPNPRVQELESRYAAVAAAVEKIPADQPRARQEAWEKLTERDHHRLTLKEAAQQLREIADRLDPPAATPSDAEAKIAAAEATLARLKGHTHIMLHQKGAGKTRTG